MCLTKDFEIEHLRINFFESRSAMVLYHCAKVLCPFGKVIIYTNIDDVL